MAAIKVFFLLCMCLFFQNAAGEAFCHQGWVNHENSCYGVGEDAMAWADAQEACEVFGAKLAEIENADENTFLKNLARSKILSAAWIGGTDIFKEGTWEWVSTRQEIEFFDWGPDEPNESPGSLGGEDCMQLYRVKDYQWNDNRCDGTANFICETEAIEVTVG